MVLAGYLLEQFQCRAQVVHLRRVAVAARGLGDGGLVAVAASRCCFSASVTSPVAQCVSGTSVTTTRMLAGGASSDSAIAAVTALIILRMISGGRPSRMDTNAMGTVISSRVVVVRKWAGRRSGWS